jgi:hypothetical protein
VIHTSERGSNGTKHTIRDRVPDDLNESSEIVQEMGLILAEHAGRNVKVEITITPEPDVPPIEAFRKLSFSYGS